MKNIDMDYVDLQDIIKVEASFSFAYGFEVLEIYRHFLIVEL